MAVVALLEISRIQVRLSGIPCLSKCPVAVCSATSVLGWVPKKVIDPPPQKKILTAI